MDLVEALARIESLEKDADALFAEAHQVALKHASLSHHTPEVTTAMHQEFKNLLYDARQKQDRANQLRDMFFEKWT